MNEKRAALEKQYREAVYVVFERETKIYFRINENSEAVNQLLDKYDSENFAFITACNPYSEVLRDAENEARQNDLRQNLSAENFNFLEGCGTDEKELWQPEKSFFIFDISPERAAEIGKEFGQNAIVYGEKEKETELIWCAAN